MGLCQKGEQEKMNYFMQYFPALSENWWLAPVSTRTINTFTEQKLTPRVSVLIGNSYMWIESNKSKLMVRKKYTEFAYIKYTINDNNYVLYQGDIQNLPEKWREELPTLVEKYFTGLISRGSFVPENIHTVAVEKRKASALEFSNIVEKRRYNAWSRLIKSVGRIHSDVVSHKLYDDKAYYSCAAAAFVTKQPLEQTTMNIGEQEPTTLENRIYIPARAYYGASEPKQINQQIIHACTTQQETPPIVTLEYEGKAYMYNKAYLENLLICISPTNKCATYVINGYNLYLVGDMGEAVLAGIKEIN